MPKLIPYCLLLCLLILSSCYGRKYYLGNISSPSMLDPKPIYKNNGREKATYIGGNYSRLIQEFTGLGSGGKTNKSKSIDFLEFEISRGASSEFTYSSIGAFAYSGIFHANDIPNHYLTRPVEGGQLWFAGGGIDYENGIKVSLKRWELRAFGIKTNLYYENGSYTSFRKDADAASRTWKDDISLPWTVQKREVRNINPLGIGFNLLGTHEFIYLLKKGTIGLTIAYGFGTGIVSTSLGMTFSRGPINLSLNNHLNAHGRFMNASLKLRLPR